jgi:hypothetical protein
MRLLIPWLSGVMEGFGSSVVNAVSTIHDALAARLSPRRFRARRRSRHAAQRETMKRLVVEMAAQRPAMTRERGHHRA